MQDNNATNPIINEPSNQSELPPPYIFIRNVNESEKADDNINEESEEFRVSTTGRWSKDEHIKFIQGNCIT